MGDRVIMMCPIAGNAKFKRRWQGPRVVVEVKSPYSYTIEINNVKHDVHINKIRKYNERIERAINNNCSVIYEKDREFGTIEFPTDPVDAKYEQQHIKRASRTSFCRTSRSIAQ